MTTYHATHVGALQPRDPFASITVPPFLAGPQRPLCADRDPELWFENISEDAYNTRSRQGLIPEAVKVCMECPLIRPCQLWALEHGEHGIWGGLTEYKRTKIRKRQAAA